MLVNNKIVSITQNYTDQCTGNVQYVLRSAKNNKIWLKLHKAISI